MDKFKKYFTQLGINTDKVLEMSQFSECSYIGQFPAAQRKEDGTIDFFDRAVDVFYQPNPNRELGHSNYFSVYVRNGQSYIANAEYVTDLIMSGVITSTGDILYARYQHDFRYDEAQEFGVDGGWWVPQDGGKYTMIGRTISSVDGILPKFVTLIVDKDKLVEAQSANSV